MKRLTIPTFLMAGALLFNACSEGGSPTDVNLRDDSPQFHHGDGSWSEAVLVAGNPTCVSQGYVLGYKFDPPVNAPNPFGITFTIAGLYLTEWESDVPIAGVIVKGGPNAYLYKYNPAALSDTDDPGLHAPIGPNGQPAGISHLEFCINPELAISKTAETSYKRKWTWDIEKSKEVDLPLEGIGEEGLLSVEYTVTLSATSEDKNHKVTGTITIHNPAAFNLAASITSVTDVLTPGPIAATVDCGAAFPIPLPSGATLECDYEALVADDATDLNTATVVSTGVLGGTATAAVEWGDPDPEIDECVDVSDLLTINGIAEPSEYLGKVCAEDLDANDEYEFIYTRTFGAGGDFPLACGNNTVDNTASFITNDKGRTGEASEGFEIFVICEEPGDAETAWAANGNTPLEDRYVDSGNWATYVTYTGEKTVTLFAGQTINVGTVHFSAAVGGKVTITINLTGGWEFEPGSIVAVQDYEDEPIGINPSPGLFDHKASPTSATQATIEVPENNYYGVHAVVVP
jgi:hypothetical protein